MKIVTEPAGPTDKRGNTFVTWWVKGMVRADLIAVVESMGADLLVFRDRVIQDRAGGYRARFTAYAGDVCLSDQLKGIEAASVKRARQRPEAQKVLS